MVVVEEDLVQAATQLARCHCAASHFARVELMLICNMARLPRGVQGDGCDGSLPTSRSIIHRGLRCRRILVRDDEVSLITL